MASPKFNSLYNEARILELAASLRHLRFSLHRGNFRNGPEVHMQFWNQVVAPRILQPAINLESLEISRESCEAFDVSELTTYPRLAALSLSAIDLGESTINQGDNTRCFPVEDFIARHRITLRKLNLYNCRIRVDLKEPTSAEMPLRSWADVYDRLAELLTELVELVVVIKNDGYDLKYFSFRADDRGLFSEWAERDKLALEHFKAVVENRKMDAGSSPQQ